MAAFLFLPQPCSQSLYYSLPISLRMKRALNFMRNPTLVYILVKLLLGIFKTVEDKGMGGKIKLSELYPESHLPVFHLFPQ